MTNNQYRIDRRVDFQSVKYRVIEVMDSDHLLVVQEERFEQQEYPMDVSIIPSGEAKEL